MLHRKENARQRREYANKKCHGRSFTQAVTFKTKTTTCILQKNINSSRCYVSFCKLELRKHTVRELQSLVRLEARGSPLRTHTHGSFSEISTMNSVTKYPTSTIDKNTPTDPRRRGQSQESSFRTLLLPANGEKRSTPTWRAGEFRPFIINYSIEQNM